MKKALSILLVMLTLTLSKNFVCYAEPEVETKTETVATVVEEKDETSKDEEKNEKAGNIFKNVENSEKPKKESISLEISAETIDKIRQVLNSEVPQKRTKTQLAIETVFSILLGVGLFCSVKNQCFGAPTTTVGEAVITQTNDNSKSAGWFEWTFGLAKRGVLKAADKVANVFPFYLLLKYF